MMAAFWLYFLAVGVMILTLKITNRYLFWAKMAVGLNPGLVVEKAADASRVFRLGVVVHTVLILASSVLIYLALN